MCKKCISILVDPKDNRSWKEQNLDWSMKPTNINYTYGWNDTGVIKYQSYKPFDDNDTDEKLCICGVAIRYNFYVYNNKRALSYLLGCICIKHHDGDKNDKNGAFNNNKEIVETINKLISDKHDKKHGGDCKTCKKHVKNIKNHELSKRHKDKHTKITSEYRQCCDCEMYNVRITAPGYHQRCRPCYFQSLQS